MAIETIPGTDLNLIREAIRFFVWGAGEGLSPVAGEPAEEPETFLFEYAEATGDEDYDGFADKIMDRIARALLAADRAARVEEREACAKIVEAVDSNRGNEAFIAHAIRAQTG